MIIPLTQGCCMVVDDDAPPAITDHTWIAHRRGEMKAKKQPGKIYAARIVDGKVISAHRVIVEAPEGLLVDHINGCTLDNRRKNLRLATAAENSRNQSTTARTRRGLHKGVQEVGGRYRARIIYDGNNIHLGMFKTSVEAARAYDHAARQYFGEFAHTNFPSAEGTEAAQ